MNAGHSYLTEGKPQGQRQAVNRLHELERENRELIRRLAELQGSAPSHSVSPAGGSFGSSPLLRRIQTRMAALARIARALARAQRVLGTGMFDAAAYKELAGLTGVSDRKAAAHYATVGELKGIRPNAGFDPLIYADGYPDLAKDRMSLLVHYARFGKAEGRIPAFDLDAHIRNGRRPLDRAKPMAVLVCHAASRTGAPILGWNLVRALGETHNVIAVLLRDGELVDRFLDDAAIVVGPFKSNALIPLAMTRLATGLDQRFGIDFAIANSIECHPALIGLAATFIPTVSLIHEFAVNVDPPGGMTSGLMMSTQVVFDAEVQRQSALDAWPGVTTLTQHVFHQGASEVPRAPANPGEQQSDAAAKRNALYRRVRGPDDRPVVLGLGTISMRKGVDLFVSCAQAVAKSLGPDRVRFVWIGDVPEPHPEGIYCNWVTDQVKRAGLDKIIVFLDPVDDLSGAYAAADVLFSPSRLDPFPNVAMDAALAGVPVVCFERANGFSEFLAADEATRSLAVPYLDVAASAERVMDLLHDEERRASVGQALKRRAAADFPMRRYIERLQPVIATAKAIAAQEKRDVDSLLADPTFSPFLWCNPHEPTTREKAIRLHVRKAASGQEANQYCRRPALGFVPQIYAEHHAALQAVPFENPLAHWVRSGKPQGPWSHRVVIPTERARPGPSRTLRTALHLHLHYPELADGILANLAANQAALNLLVTTTSDDRAADLTRRFAAYDRGPVEVRTCPNRGRDIGPMLTLLADELQSYDLVGHFHGKRSLALTSVGLSADLGVRWHEFLLQHLIGDKFPMVDIILGRFAGDEKLGLVFPEDPNLTGWSLDRDLAVALAARMNPTMVVPKFIDFPIGTMFWARPPALKPLFDLKLGWEDYPEEPVPIDGTMLHALERLLPVICQHAGFGFETTHIPGVSR